MVRIIVRPEDLRLLSRQCEQSASALRSAAARLGSALGSLEWQVRQQTGVDAQWEAARIRALSLAERGEGLARFLSRKAQAFEEADRAGVAAVGLVAGAFSAAVQKWDEWFPGVQPLPSAQADRLMGLGGWLGKLPAAAMASVSGLLAGLWAGIEALRPEPPPLSEKYPPAHSTGPAPVPHMPPPDTYEPPLVPPPHALAPVNPADYSSCALYAAARRPDLGKCGGSAYMYTQVYAGTGRLYHMAPEIAQGDLRHTRLSVGTAVVWQPGVQGAHAEHGHVAIIEEIGPDYVVISEAGWADSDPSYLRRLPASSLTEVDFIL